MDKKLQTKEAIANWLDMRQIKNYTISNNLTVNVDGEVDISNCLLSTIPVQFGIVTGYFDCSHNQLNSLKGAPHEVHSTFDCSYNWLSSLDYLPKNVNNKIYCLYNKIQIKDPISINCDMFIHQCNYEEDKIEVFRDLYINIENQDQESFILDIDDSEANNYMIIYFEKKQMEQLLSSLSNQSKKLKV